MAETEQNPVEHLRTLATDQRVDCTLVLPEQVAREAEMTATMLLRLTPYPAGPAAWRDYHSRFLDRYGTREWGMDHYVSIAEDYGPYTEGEAAELSMPVYDVPEPVTLAPGDPIPVLLKDKTVTGAELVQGTLHTHSGGMIEVPVWKLLTADGMHYPVLALVEEALDYQTWE